MVDVTRDCTTCARVADPTDTLHCQPCTFFTDGTPPTNWLPISLPQAPAHPPSAPYTDTQRLDWMLPLVTLLVFSLFLLPLTRKAVVSLAQEHKVAALEPLS